MLSIAYIVTPPPVHFLHSFMCIHLQREFTRTKHIANFFCQQRLEVEDCMISQPGIYHVHY